MPFTAGQTLRAADVATSSATVATSETRTLTTYGDLTTAGPAVTIVTGTAAMVHINCSMVNSVSAATFMGFAVSGATTIAASDARALELWDTSTGLMKCGITFHVTGLTAGSNTFTAKYRVASGTGTFVDRNIIVQPA